ncbi:MAG: cysteine synthase family protein [Prevotellaceae bacterium]|jgi:cysteine synthase A|nr:cysteine synthase family protein [Prevotellaceae bacterium]
MKPDWDELNRLIGNTPMIGIQYRYKDKERTVYVKCEHYNLTGSIKDRMALYILRKAYENGSLAPEHTIVEATSGNTGIAFSALGSLLGHRVRIIMPDWMSVERKLMIKSYGAEIIPISKEQGGFLGSIRLSQEMAKADPKVFLPCQFSNEANICAHQETTGQEIRTQLAKKGLTPDAFVAGVGTGGTVIGVGRTLRTVAPKVKVHPLEPEESPTITTGHKVGAHRIQGISDEFIPAILHADKWDEVIQASDGDAILMAQQLASSLGLGVGISSGANLIGAIKLQDQYGGRSVVATVFPDSNKKYLSTDLTKPEPVKANYISPKVELMGFCVLEKAR